MNNNNKPKKADTSKIDAAGLLVRAMQTKNLPVGVAYLRDIAVKARRGNDKHPPQVTIAVDDTIVKSVRGPTDAQEVVVLVVSLPPPEEPSLIVKPGA